MNSAQFGFLLKEAGMLLESAGAGRDAHGFAVIADAFALGGNQSVSKSVAKVQEYWRHAGRTPHCPASYKHQLERLLALMEASAAKGTIKDIKCVLELFAGDGVATPENFAAELKTAIESPKKKTSSKPASKSKSRGLPPAQIEELGAKLKSLLSDNAAFDAAFEQIEHHKKGELSAIADVFFGEHRKFDSKGKILKAMRNHQLQHAIGASRDRRQEKIAV